MRIINVFIAGQKALLKNRKHKANTHLNFTLITTPNLTLTALFHWVNLIDEDYSKKGAPLGAPLRPS